MSVRYDLTSPCKLCGGKVSTECTSYSELCLQCRNAQLARNLAVVGVVGLPNDPRESQWRENSLQADPDFDQVASRRPHRCPACGFQFKTVAAAEWCCGGNPGEWPAEIWAAARKAVAAGVDIRSLSSRLCVDPNGNSGRMFRAMYAKRRSVDAPVFRDRPE